MESKVLIVEDEWLIADDYSSILHEAGHRVVGPCPTVKAALLVIDKEQVDAALLDLELRGETSIPVAERLLELQIPFTFLSGHSVKELPRHVHDQRLLSKPANPARLLAAVAEMCAGAAGS